MPFSDLSSSDILALGIDGLIISLVVLFNYSEGSSLGNCRKIEISEEALEYWRLFLYSSVYTTWITAFFTFVTPSSLRFVFHGVFLIGVTHNLHVSVPAYVCKKMGFGGTCNCDFYKYTDFLPMVILGITGALIFLIFDLDVLGGLITIGLLFMFSLIAYYFLPERELQMLKYPSYMLLADVDNLQKFLIERPHERKLITIVDAKCDFCEIQINEMLEVRDDLKNNNIRIYDLTFKEEIDPIITMTLNIDASDSMPVPVTIIFDSGMAIEQKDGVLTKDEIESILMYG